MVKYTDIHAAIVSKIKNNFADIDVVSTDIKEGIKSPYFFVSLENVKSTDFMGVTLDREFTVRIHYFPSNRNKNKIELLKIQDTLNEVFLQDGSIQIDEQTNVEAEELEFEIVDQTLYCYFDLILSEEYDRSTDNEGEVMEELHVKNL